MVYIRGRFSPEAMLRLVGQDRLPVVEGSSRLAYLLAWECHEEDHNMDVPIMLARLRRKAWVTRARYPVKAVVSACMKCRLSSTRVVEQTMGDLPEQTLEQTDPFRVCSLDLFGPLMAKGMGADSRKQFKVWGALYACLGTKAVSLWACPGYDTDSFHLAHTKQVSVYGEPRIVLSDQGTQLRRAAKDLIDWEQIAHKTAKQGTVWKFTPPACPWRNGQAERSIAIAKRILVRVVGKEAVLNYAELETLFVRVGALMNSRPLSARINSDGYWLPICPRDLLHGRATGLEDRLTFQVEQEADTVNVPRKLERIVQLEKAFWARWSQDGFPLFCPKRKWTSVKRNVEVGDIVLLKYERSMGEDKFRLAKIESVKEDRHGRVRTVQVLVRDRRRAIREKVEACRAGLVAMEVAVQRLVVILPREEAWGGGVNVSTN